MNFPSRTPSTQWQESTTLPQLVVQGYRYVSVNVKSLFTNIPLKKVIKIILKRVYDDKQISTNLKPRTLKKLLKDCCTETPFSFNGELYHQIDGVSMGSPLGPTLANILMTELEDDIIRPLITSDKLKFYVRYVDDTLVLAKPEDTHWSLISSTPSTHKFNSHMRNLWIIMMFTSWTLNSTHRELQSIVSQPIKDNTGIIRASLHGHERLHKFACPCPSCH